MHKEIAQEAVDGVFEEFGDKNPTQYTPPGGGTSVDCIIIRARADTIDNVGLAAIVEQTDGVRVRASQVADPKTGGQFTVGGETIKIAAKPTTTDSERLIWFCPIIIT